MLRSVSFLGRQAAAVRPLLALNPWSEPAAAYLSTSPEVTDTDPGSPGDTPVWGQRSRFEEYYNTIIAKELLLKTKVKHFQALPKLKRIDISVQSNDVLRKPFVEKWQMLMHSLGLELVTGQRAFFAQHHGRQFRSGNVSAACVTLRGTKMYSFLEKLMVLALPNQVGFMGFREDSIDSQGNMHLKLGNLLNFPDFEEHFDTFEDLKSVHVTLVFQNSSKEYTKLLLSAFHFPFVDEEKESEE